MIIAPCRESATFSVLSFSFFSCLSLRQSFPFVLLHERKLSNLYRFLVKVKASAFFFLNIFSIIIQNGVPRLLEKSEAVVNRYSYYSGEQNRIKRPTPTKFSRTTNPTLLLLKVFHCPLSLLALGIIVSDTLRAFRGVIRRSSCGSCACSANCATGGLW